jgi:hypothetical protein
MIALQNSRKPDDGVPEWHRRFLALIPAVRRCAEFSFRKFRPDLKKEMVDEVVVNALAAFARLVERGKEELAFPSSLAEYAVKQLRQGRELGNRLTSKDVSSRYAQQRKGFQVERLDQYDEAEGKWKEVLIEDRRQGDPAGVAAARIDVGEWLASLTSERRQIAQCLAAGATTIEAARRFHLTPGRISQLRREFQQSWLTFHGETVAAGAAAA